MICNNSGPCIGIANVYYTTESGMLLLVMPWWPGAIWMVETGTVGDQTHQITVVSTTVTVNQDLKKVAWILCTNASTMWRLQKTLPAS